MYTMCTTRTCTPYRTRDAVCRAYVVRACEERSRICLDPCVRTRFRGVWRLCGARVSPRPPACRRTRTRAENAMLRFIKTTQPAQTDEEKQSKNYVYLTIYKRHTFRTSHTSLSMSSWRFARAHTHTYICRRHQSVHVYVYVDVRVSVLH